jgi:2-methylfumaryl-CoA isomerase
MYQLLSPLRVVELASFIAAPICSLHLQQFGAKVIRIDPIGGGPDFKRWPLSPEGRSFYWEGLNKGKLSVAIDLSKPAGRSLAIDLITAPGEDAGLFVTNFPTNSFLAHAPLLAKRQDLITVRVTGWGDGSAAMDYSVNAALGIPLMTGPVESSSQPINHVLPAWDLLTGAYAAFAAVAAERHRKITGLGQEIIVPLSDLALSSLGHMGQIAEVLTSGDRPRMGNAIYGAFGRDFSTKDKMHVMVVAITSKQWSGLLEALQLKRVIEELEKVLDISFAIDEGNRFIHREILFPIFERSIGALDLAELQVRFELNAVCWSQYRTLGNGLAEDPHLSLNRPLFSMLDHPSGHRYPAPGAAATLGNVLRGSVMRAPYLGEHTDQVLTEVLSMSITQIGALHDGGIIASD